MSAHDKYKEYGKIRTKEDFRNLQRTIKARKLIDNHSNERFINSFFIFTLVMIILLGFIVTIYCFISYESIRQNIANIIGANIVNATFALFVYLKPQSTGTANQLRINRGKRLKFKI